MSIQILPNMAGLDVGLRGLGSGLARGLEKRGERKHEAQKLEKQQARQAKTGTILQRVLSDLPKDASFQKVQGALAQALNEGADPTVVNQFAQQYAPIFKEQAKVQGAEQFMQNLRQPGAPGAPSGIQQVADGTPEVGAIYDQSDGVPDNIDQNTIDAYRASPYPQIQAMGKQYDNRRKESRRKFENDRTFHAKGLVETEKKYAKLRSEIPKRERVLQLAHNAVESGEVGAFSKNRLAQMIGGPIGDAMMTMSGAQFATAAKENLVTSLGEVTARAANMFMEKRMIDAFAKQGQTEEANLGVLDFFESENDINKAIESEFTRLARQDMERYGFKRNDLDERAIEASMPQQEKILNRSSLRNRQLIEKSKGAQWMYKQVNKKVDKGTPITPSMFRIFVEKIGDPEKALKRVKQLGYTILSPENDLPGGSQ